MNAGNGAQADPPVLVIVPVYRGLGITRNCLESLADCDLPPGVSVLVIDDCSPEPGLSEYCREVTARAGFELMVNDENLGFVASANRGFDFRPEADVILLNSDTVVANDWIERLRACAYHGDRVGTVTPFSNNGTICSYPVFLQSSDLPAGWSAAELDQLVRRANAGTYVEVPTGVGFCLYVRRSCLDETGPFDVDNFGQGYGEECDFCLRAADLGWRHHLAADTFVYHEGGASFAGESARRKREADGVLNELHPRYHELVTDFIERDPPRDCRAAIDAGRISERPDLAPDLLEEQRRNTDTLRERLQEYSAAIGAERDRAHQLDLMLEECRQRFEEVDSALSDARRVVDDLNAGIAQQKKEIENGQIYAHGLETHIHNMEQSRSWRYTAWLRRKPK